MARAHPIQRYVERLVLMYMRKVRPTLEFTQPFSCTAIGSRLSQPLKADDADHSSRIADGPGMKFAGARLFQGFLNRQLRTPRFAGIPHRLSHPALSSALRFRRRQMNAVLVRQHFVDRLLLKSCGDEKAHQV